MSFKDVITLSGRVWKWIHLTFVFIFIAIWIAAVPTGWIHSVTFVSHMSMAALVYAAASAWQAARAEQSAEKSE